jgi:hypothetical protein
MLAAVVVLQCHADPAMDQVNVLVTFVKELERSSHQLDCKIEVELGSTLRLHVSNV